MLQVPFDDIITAQDVLAYKPSHRHFEAFMHRHAAASENWIHVACSYFHDIVPASEMGIRRVWINRTESSEPVSLAQATLPDMVQLPATLRQLIGAGPTRF